MFCSLPVPVINFLPFQYMLCDNGQNSFMSSLPYTEQAVGISLYSGRTLQEEWAWSLAGGLSQPQAQNIALEWAQVPSVAGWVPPTHEGPGHAKPPHPHWHPYSLSASTYQPHFSCTWPLRIASYFPSSWGQALVEATPWASLPFRCCITSSTMKREPQSGRGVSSPNCPPFCTLLQP